MEFDLNLVLNIVEIIAVTVISPMIASGVNNWRKNQKELAVINRVVSDKKVQDMVTDIVKKGIFWIEELALEHWKDDNKKELTSDQKLNKGIEKISKDLSNAGMESLANDQVFIVSEIKKTLPVYRSELDKMVNAAKVFHLAKTGKVPADSTWIDAKFLSDMNISLPKIQLGLSEVADTFGLNNK